ncbi:MAG: zinc-binding dehydrogenase [Planctomycetes bacterium]|nr:zinc-binding dehydrogenase [Planctomycetota bacterium]
MKAWVIRQPGGPQQLRLEELPRPEPRPGWALIRIRAFGINRSEYFTRIGQSPGVRFPRVLGIECVGEIVAAGGADLRQGQQVAAIMNGMGREFDGGYAEYTLAPHRCLLPFASDLPWEQIAAYPEMLQTAHGSLHQALEIERARSILIRGGTSSIGMAALALAKREGVHVATTSRSEKKVAALKAAGADEVWIDDGQLAGQIEARRERMYDRVLELIGATTLLDSLRCVERGGIVCMTGILGGRWVLDDFHPMRDVPTAVKLTSYAGETSDLPAAKLQEYLLAIANGELTIGRGPVFAFGELVQAHELMDRNAAGGKIVVRGLD